MVSLVYHLFNRVLRNYECCDMGRLACPRSSPTSRAKNEQSKLTHQSLGKIVRNLSGKKVSHKSQWFPKDGKQEVVFHNLSTKDGERDSLGEEETTIDVTG